MFLKRLSQASRDECGVALAAVIGVMAVCLIFATIIMTSVVGAFGSSSALRAGTQSQAAADSGISKARAGLYIAAGLAGSCGSQPIPGTYKSTVAPVYSASIEYDTGAGWTSGCPTTSAKQIRITSSGSAASAGVMNASSGDASKVEAIFNYLTPGVDPSGVAMYLYKGAVIQANSNLDLTEASGAGLVVKNGNFLCDKNNGVINSSVVINGDLTLSGKCSINGNAWVSGGATLGTGSVVSGDLSSSIVTPNPPGAHVVGTYTPSGVLPDLPPDWVDVGYVPTDWVDPSGVPYEVRTVTSASQCTLPDGNLGGTITKKPVIMNMLGCAAGPTASNNTTVKLTSDVVIFAKQFTFTNSLKFQSSSGPWRVWFITPDTVVNGVPDCPSALATGDFKVINNLEITSPVGAMLYTPCAFDAKNGFEWHGQIYAGKYSYIQNNPKFTFVSMGLAGVDLDAGTPAPVITSAQPGTLISQRDRK